MPNRKTKLFELLNALKKPQIKDLRYFCKMSSNQLNKERAALFNRLLDRLVDRIKQRGELSEDKFQRDHLNDVERKNWASTKNAFFKMIERYLLSDKRVRSFFGLTIFC